MNTKDKQELIDIQSKAISRAIHRYKKEQAQMGCVGLLLSLALIQFAYLLIVKLPIEFKKIKRNSHESSLILNKEILQKV